jgi:hypothetical protein
MHDDDVMDRLLTDVMAADVPQLSPVFDARLMRRVRPRRLTAIGRPCRERSSVEPRRSLTPALHA